MLLGTLFLRLVDHLGSLTLFPGKALLELLDASSGIDEGLLAGVEGVRSARDVELEKRVFLAVFPLNRFGGFYRRTGEEGKVCVEVLKDHFAIVVGVNLLFHRIFSGLQQSARLDIPKPAAHAASGPGVPQVRSRRRRIGPSGRSMSAVT